MKILLALIAAWPWALAAAALEPAYHDASPAECEVYAAYLDKSYKPAKKDGPLARAVILIENESLDAWMKNRRAWERFLTGRITGPGRASDACMAAFWSRPQQVLRFFKFPATSHALRLLRSDEINRVLNSGGWDAFYKAYPGVNGFLSFGVIAWGPKGDEALFTARSLCGPKCGYRDIVYMQKINGEWHIIIKESLP